MAWYSNPTPNGPSFSFSSVPARLYSTRMYRTGIHNSTLGKRDRHYRFSPSLLEERARKRRKCLISTPLGHTLQLDGKAEPRENENRWHFNNRFVRKFDRQELLTHVRGSAHPLSQPNLQLFGNDHDQSIHPLFRSLECLATYVPDFAPVLRLATRFLLSKHTLPFFHNLIVAPLHLLQQESTYYQVPLFHLPPSEFAYTGLPQPQYNITFNALVALTPHIKFVFTPDGRIQDKWAYTERHYPPDHTKYSTLTRLFPHPGDLHLPRQIPLTPAQQLLTSLDFHGTNTLINISPSFLSILHLHNFLRPSPAQRLRAAYFLATTLIHELVHSIYLTRMAPPPQNFGTEEYEPFFANQRRAELGHALETTLFAGGKLLSLANDPTFSIGLGWQRWPDAADTNVRDPRTGNAVPLARLEWNASTGNVEPSQGPRWETLYAVPDAWIKRQFCAEFWDGIERLGLRSGALRVDKALGSRCENYDWVDRRTASVDGAGDERSDDCSSRGRGDDGEGVVRPGQAWRGFDVGDEYDEDDE